MRKCILDVDGTLWDFHSVLIPILAERYDFPADIRPAEWEWYLEYMTDEQFYEGVAAAHEYQMTSEPFEGADELFDALYEKNYEVIVASHRERYFAADLASWLVLKVSDKWSGLYAGPSKNFLISEGDLVIDDSPITIEYALSIGAESWALKWPWNEHTNALKFKNLRSMAKKLRMKR